MNLTTDGNIFENSIYTNLRRLKNIDKINFWRTASKQEVDFIINNDHLNAYEVKSFVSSRSFGGMKSFLSKYERAECYLVTMNKDEKQMKDICAQVYPWEIK